MIKTDQDIDNLILKHNKQLPEYFYRLERKDFTCEYCRDKFNCDFSFDIYNTNDDCLAEK